MKTIGYTILFIFLFLSCARSHHEIVVVKDSEVVNVTEENSIEMEPPPPNLSCADSLSLKNLFIMLCNKAKPVSADSAAKYHLVLYRIKDCMAVRFLSDKEYTSKDTVSANLANRRKRFPFYPLSKAGYHNMGWKPMFTKIRAELKDISKTSDFKNSTLARARSVTVQLNDLSEVVLK